MPHPSPSRARLPAAIWTLGLVSLFMDVSSEMIHSLLPVYLVTGLGASALAVGLIEGLGEALALGVRVFSGALSDWWGRRKPLALVGYGMGALSKPLFALASGTGLVLGARLLDRTGKGIRGAPRDALVAELAPVGMRHAAFGLRQALDTVGAFLGPLIALGLMLLWADDFRAVFWVAVIPALVAVGLLLVAVREPAREPGRAARNPIRRENLARLPRAYWWVVALGAAIGLARFSEAFLLLRAEQGGLPLALVPLVLIAMNVVYSLCAYPVGRLADRWGQGGLLALGLVVLIAADAALAWSPHWGWVWLGASLWGLHLGITQSLLAAMVAGSAPADLLGTAFGLYHLVSGVALLLASTLAGLVWDQFGAPYTFGLGGILSALALGVLALRPRP